jgi:hypothetical protein
MILPGRWVALAMAIMGRDALAGEAVPLPG